MVLQAVKAGIDLERTEGAPLKSNFSTKLYGWLYISSFQKGMKRNHASVATGKQLKREYEEVIQRAKEIGSSRMLSSYCMGAFFIAAYHVNAHAEQNYAIFRDGLEANRLFKKALGNADHYLSEKKIAERKKWEEESHLRKYENDWVVDVLTNGENFELGYDYHECGICKLCAEEGCFELAKYLCKLDFLLADIMGMKLERTQTLAEGGSVCDFRYSRK